MNPRTLTWLIVLVDVFFILLSASSLVHALQEHKWGWAVWDAALTVLWLYWFERDITRLKD